MERVKQAAPQLLEFAVKYYLNNALWEASMEIPAAAFGATARRTVAALVINTALDRQLLHLQELLPSVPILWHALPFEGTGCPRGCSKGGAQETKDSRRRTAPRVSP